MNVGDEVTLGPRRGQITEVTEETVTIEFEEGGEKTMRRHVFERRHRPDRVQQGTES